MTMINARNVAVSFIGLTALIASGCGMLKKEQLEAKARQQPVGAQAIAASIASLSPDQTYQVNSSSTSATRTQASSVNRVLFMINDVASAFREDNLKIATFLKDKETKKDINNENALRNVPMGIALVGIKDNSTKETAWTYEMNSQTYFAAVTSQDGAKGVMTIPGIFAGGTETTLTWSVATQNGTPVKTMTVQKGTASLATYRITYLQNSSTLPKVSLTILPSGISALWNAKGGYVSIGGVMYCWLRDAYDNTIDDDKCSVKF